MQLDSLNKVRYNAIVLNQEEINNQLYLYNLFKKRRIN